MIGISTVLVMAGQGVVAPVLPLYAESFGVTAAMIGLTISVFALARLILNVPMGFVADRFGRRSVLISGPLVTCVGMIGSGFAVGIWDLLAWRFVAGAGSAMYMTGAQIYLADISTNETRARFIGTNQGALQLGQAIGPAIGGVMAEFFGLRVPFIFVGLLALFATGYAYFRVPETRHLALAQLAEEEARNGGQPRDRHALLYFMRSKDFIAVALVTMSIFFTRTATRQTLLPLVAAFRVGMSTGAIGGLLTMMAFVNLVLLAPAAMLADRFGRKIAIVPSNLVVAGALLLIAVAGNAMLMVTAAFALAVGASIAGPAPAAYVVDIAPPHLRGIAMGLYRSAGDFGFVIGPPLLGLIVDWSSYGVALSTNAALMAVTALLFLVMARETLVRRVAR
jgi:MFS transporter, DHA1 family, multidrug resistance protein